MSAHACVAAGYFASQRAWCQPRALALWAHTTLSAGAGVHCKSCPELLSFLCAFLTASNRRAASSCIYRGCGCICLCRQWLIVRGRELAAAACQLPTLCGSAVQHGAECCSWLCLNIYLPALPSGSLCPTTCWTRQSPSLSPSATTAACVVARSWSARKCASTTRYVHPGGQLASRHNSSYSSTCLPLAMLSACWT